AVADVESIAQPDVVAELARARAADHRMEAIAFDASAVVGGAPRALALAARAGLEEVRIDVMISLGVAGAHRGDPGVGELLAEALAAAQARRLPFQTIRAYVNAVAAAADARDHTTVDALADRAIRQLDDYQTAIPRENV